MAEYTYNPVQEIAVNGAAILNDSIPCTKGYLFHRGESGLVILRGIVNNGCGTFARYRVSFGANIAVPETGVASEISLSLAIDGEAIPSSRAIVTPAATDEYFAVSKTIDITVPRGCCFALAIENTSDQTINAQNVNLVITRTA